MPEKDKKSPLPEPPKNPLEFIQDLDSAVRNADGVLSGVDERLRGFDDQLTSKSERTEAPETPQHSHEERIERGGLLFRLLFEASFQGKRVPK